ncbi:MAG: Hpt domain-containing protein [Phycisphaerae bacterium]|nr:Hpt domain-containing protein [Phycisphaerae bacterium]NUQ47846.1 Hpt domain-containing protein [Phycisphaerae bacterium]
MTTISQGNGPIVSELAGDPELRPLVAAFVAELPHRVAEMRRCLGEGDFLPLVSKAHQLKGSAGGYGFPEITAGAAAVEKCARLATERVRLAAELNALADLCERARAF